jgi:hypothetical protein
VQGTDYDFASMAWLDTELERLFAPDYLNGLKDRSLQEVRTMRAECQEAETAVSYLRRVAQGRLDLVHACLDPSDGKETVDLDSLVERLPSIIGSGPPRPAGPGRLPSQMLPDMDKDDLTQEIDSLLDADKIGELPGMGRDELQAVAERLTELEARISDQRRALHERIDKLQAEIVSRYKTGEASVDGLLPRS